MGKSERQKLKELDWAGRKQYFLDYYMFPTIVIIIVMAIVTLLLWHFCLRPKEESVLYAAVIDDSLDMTKQKETIDDIGKLLGADSTHTVSIDDSFYLKDGALDKIQVYLHSAQIDVMIMDKDVFEELAGYGYFVSLNELITEDLSEKYNSEYVYAKGYLDTDEISFEDNETGQGESKPYGLSIKNSNKYADMSDGFIGDPVVAIAVNSTKFQNALTFIDYLMS